MNADLLVQFLILLISRADEIGTLLQRAKSEGRDITEEEIDSLVSKDDLARELLQKEIDDRKSKPPQEPT